MKRRKQKNLNISKKRIYQCTACGSVLSTLNEYRNHVLGNPDCKIKLPFCCQFCSYIGYTSTAFNCHLQSRAICDQFYKEKNVTTGQILDFSSAKLPYQSSSPNKMSYEFNNVAFSGMQNKIQLNLTDKTLSNMSYQKQINVLNQKKDKASDLSTYMSTGRIISSFTNEFIPFDHCVHQHTDMVDLEDLDSPIERIENEDTVIDNIPTYNIIDPDMVPINVGIIDITAKQKTMMKRFKKMKFTHSDEASIDLFHILKSSNVPLVMFDRIIRWLKRHEGMLSNGGTSGLLTRKNFLESMDQKLYEGPASNMKPKVCKTVLSSGRSSNVVSFSMKEMILRMVTNKTLFHPGNLLLDPQNPCGDQPDDLYYGDVNTGTWFKNAKINECSLPNHILMPFCHFIDGLSVDKYGKLTVEAVLTCCLWFNRKARNRSSSWWVHGFVEDQGLFRDQKTYIRQEKLQDYHDMMSKIFQEMKDIRDCGGIKLTLNFGLHGKHDVIAIPVIQYVIGDCKGNDTLCGRKGGHSLSMKGLCRDCNISPSDGDNTCVNEPLICKYITKTDIEGKNTEELNELSFIPIRNCFSNISFGGDNRGIYGSTPAEILHAVQLGLCEYIADAIDLMFTQSSMDRISSVIAGIYRVNRRQSERDLPNIGAFRNGLTSVAKLKAKERFSRVYVLLLAFCNSYLVKDLCNRKRKKVDTRDNAPFISRNFIVNLVVVLKNTLSFHQWLKKDNFLKTDFIEDESNGESRASLHVKNYLEKFKDVIHRGGNGLKTPKFHQMLHVCDYIKRHGSPSNYDGSRGENFGKIKIKDNAKLTNKQKETFNFDIGCRISEEDIIDNASNIFQQNKGYWPSEFCNDTDISENANRIQNNCIETHNSNNGVSDKPRYKLVCCIEYNETDTGIEENVNVHIDWGGQSKTPIKSYPSELLKKVAGRLYIGSPNIGGKVMSDSLVHGYTEIIHNDDIYRCHPFYSNTGSWYDWAYFDWNGFDSCIPARILMILDLSHSVINYEVDIDPDIVLTGGNVSTIQHLTKDKWMVVKAARSPSINSTQLTDDHIIIDMIVRIELDEDCIWLVPLSSLVKPCFVIYNRNYCDNIDENDICEHDSTAYIVKPMREWPECFIPNE